MVEASESDRQEVNCRWRTDTIHLDRAHEGLEVPVPVGPHPLIDLLPAVRVLAAELVTRATEEAKSEDRHVSCRAGCGTCCRQLVGISAVEAQSLAELVESMPPERRAIIEERFEQAVKKLEQVGLLNPDAPKGSRYLVGSEPGSPNESTREATLKYFLQQIACPFLGYEACSIYEDRPLICREYNVSSSAEECKQPQAGRVRKITPPMHLGVSLGKTARRLADITLHAIPITLSLEWFHANSDAMNRPLDGETMYQTWLNYIDPESDVPFDKR